MKIKYNLLIVEDSKVINFALRKYFLEKDKNVYIQRALSLKDVRNSILKSDVNFILLDLILPDGEGADLINEIKSISQAKIIVLTSMDDDTKREEFFKLGILDYFSKRSPINFIVNESIKLIQKYNTNSLTTVLIVDDSSVIRNHMKDIFLNRNYNVVTARNGKDALIKLNENSIDLMILDLEMPVMGGEEVIYEVRKRDNFLDIPIVVLSSTSDKNLISKVLKSGANDFVAKPFSIETILLKSEILLSMSYNQKEIKAQKLYLEEAQKKITDSITYSSMIQNAILPKKSLIDKNFVDNFIIWEPKDIVGGDIYLFEEFNTKLKIDDEGYNFGDGFLAIIVDCVGHGIPGAFMTMITKTAISNIINKYNYNNPASILSELNKKIKTILNQNESDSESNSDVGLDGAVLYFDKQKHRVIFASAKTPLFYIQNSKLKTIKGDRESIGYKNSNLKFEFQNSVIEIKDDTYFYVTTDGLIDQNGGKKDLPFGKKRLKNILLKNYRKDFFVQKGLLLYEIKNYQAKDERNDDVTMIGFKIEGEK